MEHYKNEYGKVKLTIQQLSSLISSSVFVMITDDPKKHYNLYSGSINSIPCDILNKYIENITIDNRGRVRIVISGYAKYWNIGRRKQSHE